MMHAKKMMLVPATDAYAQQMLPPVVPQLVSLDNEIRQILNSSNLPADAKLLSYQQILRRYMKLQNDFAEPIPPTPREPARSAISQQDPAHTVKGNIPAIPFTDAYILNAVPPKNKNAAALLLDFIKRSQSLDWTARGEMVVDGRLIPNTNIIDLVHDFARSRKRVPAEGAAELASVLQKQNVPRECVGNEARWRMIEQLKDKTPTTTPVASGASPRFSTPNAPSSKRQRKRTQRYGWEEADDDTRYTYV